MENIEAEKKLPEDIAKIVFSDQPAEPKSYQLYCQTDEDNKVIDALDLFEIFMTIMIEGIFVRCDGNVSREILNTINDNTISSLNPWLHSLGFNVNVSIIPKENVSEYENYYCKVVFRNDPEWTGWFDIHSDNIKKDYHYILGQSSPYISGDKCTLNNMYAIHKWKSTIYKISFNYI